MCKMKTNLIESLTLVAMVCGYVGAESVDTRAARASVSSARNETTRQLQHMRIPTDVKRNTENQRVELQIPNERAEPRQGILTNSYYDFLINEGSYKFWAVFQLITVAILLYSTFAAIYYAKYTFLKEVENSDVDDFLIRSTRSLEKSMFSGLDANTFLRIIDAITSNKYR